MLHSEFLMRHKFRFSGKQIDAQAIQVLSYNSLVFARQNVPITWILTNFTLGSWKDFDVDLSLIGSKEMIWKTCFETCQIRRLKSAVLVTLSTIGKTVTWFKQSLYSKYIFTKINYSQLRLASRIVFLNGSSISTSGLIISK